MLFGESIGLPVLVIDDVNLSLKDKLAMFCFKLSLYVADPCVSRQPSDWTHSGYLVSRTRSVSDNTSERYSKG